MGCSVTLVQDRNTSCKFSSIGFESIYQKNLKLYADLPGYLASISPPSTIPTNLSNSLSRSDSVLDSEDSIYLFELMIPRNTYWLKGLGSKIDMALYCMILMNWISC